MRKILKGEYGKPFINNYIVDESLTTAYMRTKSCIVSHNIQTLVQKKKNDNPIFFTIIIDNSLIKICDTLFDKFCKKGLSYTDCSILACMKEYKITYLATLDSGFDGLVTIIS